MEATVVATMGQSLLVLPLIDDDDLVGAGDGTEAMRDDRSGAFPSSLDCVGPMTGSLFLAVDAPPGAFPMSSVLRR
jgi:hypothetical protein